MHFKKYLNSSIRTPNSGPVGFYYTRHTTFLCIKTWCHLYLHKESALPLKTSLNLVKESKVIIYCFCFALQEVDQNRSIRLILTMAAILGSYLLESLNYPLKFWSVSAQHYSLLFSLNWLAHSFVLLSVLFPPYAPQSGLLAPRAPASYCSVWSIAFSYSTLWFRLTFNLCWFGLTLGRVLASLSAVIIRSRRAPWLC